MPKPLKTARGFRRTVVIEIGPPPESGRLDRLQTNGARFFRTRRARAKAPAMPAQARTVDGSGNRNRLDRATGGGVGRGQFRLRVDRVRAEDPDELLGERLVGQHDEGRALGTGLKGGRALDRRRSRWPATNRWSCSAASSTARGRRIPWPGAATGLLRPPIPPSLIA